MPPEQARTGNWTFEHMPDQSGHCAVVTGANNGLGREAARALAARGAEVVIACRDTAKGEEAADTIRAEVPGARLETLELDLSSLDSVRAAAQRLRNVRPRIDLLLNNAGLMTPPLGRTAEGFEQQFGVNHLGHFAFTGLLLDRVLAAENPRIVTVSSIAHRRGRIDFDDLHWRNRRYDRMGAYGQSKLANLMFAYELQRRLEAAGEKAVSAAAHPGVSRTGLFRHHSPLVRAAMGPALRPVNFWIAQTADRGVLPLLYAATAADVRGGGYYGPAGVGEFTGPPKPAGSSRSSHDTAAQRHLWEVSEELTGLTYPLGPDPS
ncbi:oxidoreductase [Streptomonospora salina]|uniref:NAD(P)-dependent dehydrogenase (Short-subunit alcohol dehydrogenase family) n=1 Tax=Streptomonospora salina TaxID=104205 RepID=A0A841E1U8_9ACTN|nr:oxidoreductase [Streptomonospora salina]MBB5997016.1 NAD(P)-dependent dehydrogenase (short-subunit alcohol dehydrogenase family) [Streptomonospora salina]